MNMLLNIKDISFVVLGLAVCFIGASVPHLVTGIDVQPVPIRDQSGGETHVEVPKGKITVDVGKAVTDLPIISFAMEGGGSTNSVKGKEPPYFPNSRLPDNPEDEMLKIDMSGHHQNSSIKGRKGVDFSITKPRKGVNQNATQQTLESNSSQVGEHEIISNINHSKLNINTNKTTTLSFVGDIIPPPSSTTQKTTNLPHKKKPEVVSDANEDDSDSYSIIESSTTGKDYVLIGVAIFIGIWLSIFGALVFFKRAGEFWDRRHYRRMDFLVEGMYND